jgi:DNA-binding transcriptional regulator YdaS (Cro superfamily)
MTLAQYLKSQNLPLVAFAADLGEKVTTVHGWVSGRRKPGVVSLARIERITSGAVRAADFVPEEAPEADRQPADAA